MVMAHAMYGAESGAAVGPGDVPSDRYLEIRVAAAACRQQPVYYSFRNFKISSKNWKRGFSNRTKCVAFGISTLFLTGACTRSRMSPSRSSGKDHVSKAPAITSVGA